MRGVFFLTRDRLITKTATLAWLFLLSFLLLRDECTAVDFDTWTHRGSYRDRLDEHSFR